jgi:hypothetical protein
MRWEESARLEWSSPITPKLGVPQYGNRNVTLLAPRIWSWLLGSPKACEPMPSTLISLPQACLQVVQRHYTTNEVARCIDRIMVENWGCRKSLSAYFRYENYGILLSKNTWINTKLHRKPPIHKRNWLRSCFLARCIQKAVLSLYRLYL